MNINSFLSTIIKKKNHIIVFITLVFFIVLILILVITLSDKSNNQTNLFSTKDYNVISKIKRDITIFTQGLFFDHEGYMIESGGLYGESKLLKYNLNNPDLYIAQVLLTNNIFAEGATIINNTIYQLTWREKQIYVYENNKKNLSLIKIYQMPSEINEGWGITNNDTALFISDGSSSIHIVDPTDLKVKNTITISDKLGNIYDRINELEYVKGLIFANIWYSNIVLVIDPKSGYVERKIDFIDLYQYEQNYSKENLTTLGCVLNGIAYDTRNDNYIITGKKWKHLYTVKVNENN